MSEIQHQPIALVTGASRGIGRQTALQLAEDGFFVAINYLSNAEAAEEVRATLDARGKPAALVPFDVSCREEVRAQIKRISKEYGTIEVLVNNAFVMRDSPLVRMKEEDWDDILAVDLTGAYNSTKAVLQTWAGRNRGSRIINITSIAGEMGSAYSANYAAAKAGLIGFTKSLARELAPRKITVNAVAPGIIDTDSTAHLPREEILKQIPLNRIGTPEDVAYAVSMLASPRAGYITGQVLRVNGGLYM